jgi:hypothetical protein
MGKYRKVTVNIFLPFDANADSETWETIGAMIDDAARRGDSIRNPFPVGGCVLGGGHNE